MYKGERVVLKGWELDDVPTLMEHWNDLETREFLNNQMPHSFQEEEEWIRSGWEERRKQRAYSFKIENEDGEFLGSCGLGSISVINHSAVLGIAITNKIYWNKGYGTDAMRLLISIGFRYLNLHRIELEVHEFNERAYHVYKKVGFQDIGRKRESHFVNNRYVDSILMDILREDYDRFYGENDLSRHSEWLLKQ